MSKGIAVSGKQQLPIALGCVIRDQSVLLVRRNEPQIPALHGKWELPGGKVEFGEDPAVTAQREVREETGLHVRVLEMLPFPYVAVRRTTNGLLNPIVLCFRCEALNQIPPLKLPQKVGEIAWKRLQDLDPAVIQTGSLLFISHLIERLSLNGPEMGNWRPNVH